MSDSEFKELIDKLYAGELSYDQLNILNFHIFSVLHEKNTEMFGKDEEELSVIGALFNG